MEVADRARSIIEKRYGEISDAIWDDITQNFPPAYDDTPQDYAAYVVETVRLIIKHAPVVKGVNAHMRKQPGRKPGRQGAYSKSFHKRYEQYLFFSSLKGEYAYHQLMDEPFKLNWNVITERFNSKFPDVKPKTVNAVKIICHSVVEEFDSLSEDDKYKWSMQQWADVINESPMINDDIFFTSYRKLREGRTEAELADILASLKEFHKAIANLNTSPEDTGCAEVAEDIEEDWNLDEDASFEEIMFAFGAREGWPEFSYRLLFTISAGEESWRQLVPEVPAQHKSAFVAETAESRQLAASYRKKQATKAKKAAQDGS